MEFFIIIITLLFVFPLTFPFIVSRIAICCLSFYLKRKHSINLSVAKCGLLSFRTIVISLPTNPLEEESQDEAQDQKGCDRRVVTLTIDVLRFSSIYLDSTCTSILSICISNVTIQCSLESGKCLPIKIGSLELPINKIRGDFFRHFKENFSVAVSDIVIVLDNFNYKVGKLNVIRSVGLQENLQVEFKRIIFSDLSIPEVQVYSEMHEELTKQRILFIEQLQVLYLINHSKNLHMTIVGDCFLQWSLEFHINFVTLITNIKRQYKAMRKTKSSVESSADKQPRDKIPNQVFSLKLELNGRLSIGAMVSEDQVVCIDTSNLEINAAFPGPKTIRSTLICLHFDDHAILTCRMASVSHYPSPGITCILDRKQNSCGIKLQDSANSLLCVEIEAVDLLFPYKYNFAEVFNERFMGIVKFLKKYHNNSKNKVDKTKAIDFDMSFRINKFEMKIEDDPFETKLRNNYMLLEDEYHEQLKRDQTLQEKINELKRTNLMLASSIVDELNRALAKKNSDIYVQRSKQLYSSEKSHITMLTIIIEEADLKILADSSFHHHSDIKSILCN